MQKASDGSEVINKFGDLFSWPAEQTAIVLENTKLMGSIPDKGIEEVMANIKRKIAEMGR